MVPQPAQAFWRLARLIELIGPADWWGRSLWLESVALQLISVVILISDQRLNWECACVAAEIGINF